MSDEDTKRPTITETVQDKWAWFLALGVALMIGGFAMITVPLASSVTLKVVIAIGFAVGGAVQIWHALSVKEWGGYLWDMLTGIVAVIGSLAVFFNQTAGAFAITLVVAAILLAQGATQVLLGVKVRPHDGWGWLMAAGLVSIVASLCVWFGFPSSQLWALGLIAGFSVLINGWSYIAIALSARKMRAAPSG